MKTRSQKPESAEKSRRGNPEWTAVMIAQARPARDVLPEIFGVRAATVMLKQSGRSSGGGYRVFFDNHHWMSPRLKEINLDPFNRGRFLNSHLKTITYVDFHKSSPW